LSQVSAIAPATHASTPTAGETPALRKKPTAALVQTSAEVHSWQFAAQSPQPVVPATLGNFLTGHALQAFAAVSTVGTAASSLQAGQSSAAVFKTFRVASLSQVSAIAPAAQVLEPSAVLPAPPATTTASHVVVAPLKLAAASLVVPAQAVHTPSAAEVPADW